MLGARVVIVANMKPANMRGIKSHAMVLCASSADGTQVSLCASAPGSRSLRIQAGMPVASIINRVGGVA